MTHFGRLLDGRTLLFLVEVNIVLCPIPPADGSACPSGWLERQGICYGFGTGYHKDYFQSEIICTTAEGGGELYVPSSQSEYDDVWQFIFDHPAINNDAVDRNVNAVWIGCNDAVTEGHFQCEGGATLDSAWWDTSQPAGGVAKNCVIRRKWSAGFENVECDQYHAQPFCKGTGGSQIFSTLPVVITTTTAAPTTTTASTEATSTKTPSTTSANVPTTTSANAPSTTSSNAPSTTSSNAPSTTSSNAPSTTAMTLSAVTAGDTTSQSQSTTQSDSSTAALTHTDMHQTANSASLIRSLQDTTTVPASPAYHTPIPLRYRSAHFELWKNHGGVSVTMHCLRNHVVERVLTHSLLNCAEKCFDRVDCKSFNYQEGACELNGARKDETFATNFIAINECSYYEKVKVM